MKLALERRAELARRQQRADFVQQVISNESTKLQREAAEREAARRARLVLAATTINAGCRGFLHRQIAAEHRLEKWAAITMQRHMRGQHGRRIAENERWRLVRVAPTRHALNLLRVRSKITMERGEWCELFDPYTNQFWYLHRRKYFSTWTPPEEFERDLFCLWDPFPYPYVSACGNNVPCRQRFKRMVDFQNHRTHAHSWYCPACDYKNTALLFPVCTLCGNKCDGDGVDMEKALTDRFKEAFHEWKNPPKDRESESDSESGASGDEGIESLSLTTASEDHGGPLPALPSVGRGAEQAPGAAAAGGGSVALPPLPRTPHEQHPRVPSLRARAGSVDSVPPAPMPDLPDEPNGGGGGAPSAQPAPFAGAPDLLARGMAKPPPGSEQLVLGGGSADAVLDHAIDQGEKGKQPGPGPMMLKVCLAFQRGFCKLSTCPMAHPGLRDNATLIERNTSKRNRRYMVEVCAEALASHDWNTCPQGKMCTRYHPYVRPSTMEIVRKLYPIKQGRKTKVFKSGAELDGHMSNNEPYDGSMGFNGYGVMTYPNGDVYMGDWRAGLRHGMGVFRSAKGTEYVGLWTDGVRDQWGVLVHPNGEQYEGEWCAGKISGLGRLTSANGDVYEGQLENGVYEGLGKFRKASGDVYLGFCSKGRAHGVGVLAMRSGEKYKGEFVADQRCGRGVCVYPNGCRFAGQWDRGYHSGFGVFLSHHGERYVGQWHNSTKHGKGRYFFKEGDFYDGDFRKDKADGLGVYRYAKSGNVYAGAFKNDMKNGRGTYVWQSGSKYDGWWLDNDIDGKGVFQFANGAKYQGSFKKNKKHGKGIFTWTSKNRYKGEFADDKLCGFGEMMYETTGHRHVGMWANNKKNGKGKFFYFDGNIYDGEFRDDLKHGQGKLVYAPGTLLEESYVGEFKDGERHGYGTYRYQEQKGLQYEGEWRRGLRHGRGTLRWIDGKFYRGDFLKEKMTGRGLFVWPDGSQYEGEWSNNEQHGEGTHLSANGTIYHGQFHRNLKHGPGVLTYLDGNSYSGEWSMGHIKGTGQFEFHPSDERGERSIKLRVFGF